MWRCEQTFYKVPIVLVRQQKRSECAKLLDCKPLHPAHGISAVVRDGHISKARLPDVHTTLFHLPCDLLKWLFYFIAIPRLILLLLLLFEVVFCYRDFAQKVDLWHSSGWFVGVGKLSSLELDARLFFSKNLLYSQRQMVWRKRCTTRSGKCSLGVCKLLTHHSGNFVSLCLMCLGPATLARCVCTSNCCGERLAFLSTSCCSSFFVQVFFTGAPFFLQYTCIYQSSTWPLHKSERQTRSPSAWPASCYLRCIGVYHLALCLG